MSKLLKIYFQNVRGLNTKTNIKSDISAANYDIIVFNETWLQDDFFSAEIFDESFTVFRSDRNLASTGKSRGGGCLIAIKNNISAIRLNEWENDLPFENVWLQINLNHSHKKLFINTSYITPNTKHNIYKTYFDHYTSIICNSHPNSEFVILGDFNMNQIAWLKTGCISIPFMYDGPTAADFVSLMEITNMKQLNHIHNTNGRILDIVLVNFENATLSAAEPLSRIDTHHPPLYIEIKDVNIKFMKTLKSPKINFYKLNYEQISKEIDKIDWNSLLHTNDIDSAVNRFYGQINVIIQNNNRIIRPKSNEYPKWFSTNLISILKTKEFFRKLFKRTGSEQYDIIYKEYRRRFKCEKRKCENSFIDDTENNINCNPKAFFAYTKSLSKTNKLPLSMKYDNDTSDDPKIITEFFATNFKSVYNPCSSNQSYANTNCNCSNHITITPDEIMSIIKNMNEHKTSSPDGIPSLFYKRTINEISIPLTLLFNLSLQSKTYPSEWKLSFISPIYKNGEKSDVKNYRPVSIISAASKIFEKLIYGKLFNIVGPQISAKQHGFMPKKSTVSNLIELNEYLTNNIPGGGQVDVIYTDFAKAFDKVDHNVLLNKMTKFGIGNCLISLLESFLKHRTQVVCINGMKSSEIHPTSSVPQGSSLSSLLFAMFINDLATKIVCEILLFADDVKIYLKIKSVRDCVRLQKDLIEINQWCIENKLQLNTSKCNVISFSRKSDANAITFLYKIGDTALNRTDRVKDLGVIFDNKLSFQYHITYIVNRAYRMLGFISRSLSRFKKIETYHRLYYCYIRCVLEYASPVWNPYYNIYVDKIERVQRKFTRIVAFKFNLPRETYTDRLLKMNMISLKKRRIILDQILFYKIQNGLLKTSLQSHFIAHTPVYNTRFAPIFYCGNTATNIEFFSVRARIQRQHNEIFDRSNTFSQPLDSFKRSLMLKLPADNWN